MKKILITILLFLQIGFSFSQQFSFNGSAFYNGGECYTICSDATWNVGSMWKLNQINLTQPLTAQFSLSFGNKDANGADGISFVLQQVGVNALGGMGVGIGYAGLNTSLIVEFDSYQNSPYDPAQDHIAIQKNGNQDHLSSDNLAGPVLLPNIENGLPHPVKIIWDPSDDSLFVYFDCVLRLSLKYDITQNIFAGNPMVWWGFTSATGSYSNTHIACFVDTLQAKAGNDTVSCNPVQLNGIATGVQPLTYLWSPATGLSDPNILNPVANPTTATTYTLSVMDGCGFTATDDVNVTVNTFTADAGEDRSICSGETTNLNAGDGMYYSWSPPSSLDNPNIQNPVTIPLTATTNFIVTVTNANGCTATDSVLVTVNPLPAVDAGLPQTICNGQDVILTATGGSNYQWNTGESTSSITVSPAATTTYTVTAFSGGCSGTDDVIITLLNTTSIDAGSNVAICAGDHTQLNATGGNIYSWSPASGLSNTSVSNPVANPSVTTTYFVNSSALGGNIITNGDFEQGYISFLSSYTYQSNLYPEGTFYTGTNPHDYHASFGSCSDHTGGTGNMMIINGSGTPGTNIWCQTISISANTNYEFSTWATSVNPSSPAILQFSINGLMLGTPFNLISSTCTWNQFFSTWNSGNNTTADICIVNQNTAIGGNDFALDDIYFSPICNSTDSVIVTVSPTPVADAGLPQTICSGQNVTLTATGGSNYLWNSGESTASITVSPASTTTYIVTASSGSCSGTDNVVITVNPNPIISISATANPICAGSSAILTATGSGNYTWNTGSTMQSIIISPVSTTTYTITVSNAFGCSVNDSVVVTVKPLPEVIDSDITNVLCNGGNTGQISLTTGNSDPPYSYLWNTVPAQTSANANNLEAGNYTVTITGNSGCDTTYTYTIIQPPEITINLVPADEKCLNSCDGQVASIVTGGAGSTYFYLWSNGQTTQNAVGLCPGSYMLTVTDTNACSKNNNALISTSTIINSDFTASPVSGNAPLTVNFLYTGSIASTYQWNFGDGGASAAQNPSYIFDTEGTYPVTLVVNSGNPDFCTDTFKLMIEVLASSQLVVPNVFTPNGDSFNDEFIIQNQGIETFNCTIYNRWGNKIYEWNDISKGWDGKTESGKDSPDGVYYYVISAKGKDKIEYNEQGTVTLLK